MANVSDKLYREFGKLAPSGLIELYILDATEIGGDRLYFYDGTDTSIRPEVPNPEVKFQGQAYFPMPIQVNGFEMKTQGEMPIPKITFSNVFGTFSALSILFDDLMGAKLIRKRTLRKYLDEGSDPNPDAEMPIDVFYVDRKASENKQTVQYELGTQLDVDGVFLPFRQISANICGWRYRSPPCGFAENRFVSDLGGLPFTPGGDGTLPLVRFLGDHDPSKIYKIKDGVRETISSDEEKFYVWTDASPSTVGLPLSDSRWYQIQHYLGLWSKDTAYVRGDVTYIMSQGVRVYFLLTAASATGEAFQPPNLAYWMADQCGKLLTNGCKLRFDSQNRNLPLPFGAFPGTALVPELSQI